MSITLPTKMAEMVREKVASGAYASESEVIRDGLRSLQEREAAMERWLRNEVVPAYDEYIADPSSAVPLDEAFDRVMGELEKRDKAKRA
ncbi:MAG TPA: type II toxin-antitoxin system ParD family antitoxin [Caulobacteraceae bacterium]